MTRASLEVSVIYSILLLTRVRDYHPADDEVKQAYRINSKSFPVCWLAIPEELYGGCKGKRKWRTYVNLVLSTIPVNELYRKFPETLTTQMYKGGNFIKRYTFWYFFLPEYEERVLWFYLQPQRPTLKFLFVKRTRPECSSVFHGLKIV